MITCRERESTATAAISSRPAARPFGRIPGLFELFLGPKPKTLYMFSHNFQAKTLLKCYNCYKLEDKRRC